MNFDHQTALVTGGASGIGRATVLALARAGAEVVCADIDQRKGGELVEETRAAGLAVGCVPIDLADAASVRRCAADVLQRHPRLDILINAAGFGAAHPFLETPPDYIERLIAGNLIGALHLTQAVLPSMIAVGRGKIVNVS